MKIVVDILEWIGERVQEKRRIGRNSWFEARTPEPAMNIYVRFGWRCVNGQDYNHVLDISNVTIHEKWQVAGVFTGILENLEQCRNIGIYIENVLSVRLQKFFERRPGYVLANKPTHAREPRCYFLAPRGDARDA